VTESTLPSAAELSEIASEVWSSFLDDALVEVEHPGDGALPHDRTIGWVSISGDWTGHLYVTTSGAGAREIASNMFQLDAGEISDSEIADALGEIANMVGGSVKGMVGGEVVLSLPQVVLNAGTLISPEAHQRVRVSGSWHGEPVEFAVWEREVDRVGENA